MGNIDSVTPQSRRHDDMKPKRKLEMDVHSCTIVTVGYKGSRLASAWFWENEEHNAVKNAKAYVKWRNSRRR